METCLECSTIGGCPFSFTGESDYIQNLGCLPTPYDIVTMRVDYGKTWSCHSNPRKPCLGALNYLRDLELPYKIIDKKLITEKDRWDYISKPKSKVLEYLSTRKFMLNPEKYKENCTL